MFIFQPTLFSYLPAKCVRAWSRMFALVRACCACLRGFARTTPLSFHFRALRVNERRSLLLASGKEKILRRKFVIKTNEATVQAVSGQWRCVYRAVLSGISVSHFEIDLLGVYWNSASNEIRSRLNRFSAACACLRIRSNFPLRVSVFFLKFRYATVISRLLFHQRKSVCVL